MSLAQQTPAAEGASIADSLDVETLAAAALVLDVGVAELERLVDALLDEIHLGPIDELEALVIHHNLDTMVVEYNVA